MSFPNHVHGKARSALGRKWGLASATRRQPSDMDWETTLWRGKHDRKGELIAEGRDYRPDKTRHWLIRHSISGDVDQVDLLIAGKVWRTGSLRRAHYAVKWGR